MSIQEKQFEKSHIKAIIGLGNPGSKYSLNRHNVGFRVVDALADSLGATFVKQGEMEIATTSWMVDGLSQSIILIKPHTYMNDSGRVISFLAKKGIKAENILVAHDELEKRLKHTSLKFGGSAKGHNGLKSSIGVIGQDFWRLRVGIDRPMDKEDVPSYVLSNFKPVEEPEIVYIVNDAVNLLI